MCCCFFRYGMYVGYKHPREKGIFYFEVVNGVDQLDELAKLHDIAYATAASASDVRTADADLMWGAIGLSTREMRSFKQWAMRYAVITAMFMKRALPATTFWTRQCAAHRAEWRKIKL